MNEKPIEMALDPDLRLSRDALLRAAQRAREVAAQTGTAIVVRQQGVLRYIYPGTEVKGQGVRECGASYDDEA